MKEAKAMAYVNMYGVLATLENLCELDKEAKAVCAAMKKPVSICFDVQTVHAVLFIFQRTAVK